MKKDKKKIPKGVYCYDHLKIIERKGKAPICKVMGACPYWFKITTRPEQENGYCAYLGKGDWDINEGAILINPKTGETMEGEDIPFPVGLLWDRVKECGINEELENEENLD